MTVGARTRDADPRTARRRSADTRRSGAPHPPRGPVPHDPQPPARLRHGGQRPRAAAPARARLRPHHVGAGHRRPRQAVHRHRPRPAGPWPLGQAARRLQRGRLRQRRARPADGAGHRPGHRRGPQLRRRRGDAVRLPVPRAHRATDPGLTRWPRVRGHPDHPRRHAARLRAGDERADAPGRTPPRQGRHARTPAPRPSGHPRPR